MAENLTEISNLSESSEVMDLLWVRKYLHAIYYPEIANI